MPFCNQCGSQLTGNFCSVCGVQVSGPESSIYIQERIRQDSLKEISNMISYFSPIRNLYEEYKQARKNADYNSNPLVGQLRLAPFLVPGIILTAVFGVFLVSLLSALSDTDNSNSVDAAFSGFIKAGLGIPISFMAIGIVLIIVAIIRKCINIRRDKKRIEACSFYESRAAECLEDIRNYYNNYKGFRIAVGYCDPEVLVQIRNLIAGGRANTITDAINLLHLEEHNANMEELAGLSAEAAVRAAVYARQAAIR